MICLGEASLTGRHPVNGVSSRTNGLPCRNPTFTDGLFVRVENPVLELPRSGPAVIGPEYSPNRIELGVEFATGHGWTSHRHLEGGAESWGS